MHQMLETSLLGALHRDFRRFMRILMTTEIHHNSNKEPKLVPGLVFLLKNTGPRVVFKTGPSLVSLFSPIFVVFSGCVNWCQIVFS